MVSTNRAGSNRIIFRAVSRPSHEIVTELDSYYLQYFLAFAGPFSLAEISCKGQTTVRNIIPRQRTALVELSNATRFSLLAYAAYINFSDPELGHTRKYLSNCYKAMQRSISDGPSIELVYSSYIVCSLSAWMDDRHSFLIHVRGFCETIISLKRSKQKVPNWEWRWVEDLSLDLLIRMKDMLSSTFVVEDVGYALKIITAFEGIQTLWQEFHRPCSGNDLEDARRVLFKLYIYIAIQVDYYLFLLNASSKDVQCKKLETTTEGVLRNLTSLLSLLLEPLSRIDDQFLIKFHRWQLFRCHSTSSIMESPNTSLNCSFLESAICSHCFWMGWNYYGWRPIIDFALGDYAIKCLYEASISSLEEDCGPSGIEVWLFLVDCELSSGYNKGLTNPSS